MTSRPTSIQTSIFAASMSAAQDETRDPSSSKAAGNAPNAPVSNACQAAAKASDAGPAYPAVTACAATTASARVPASADPAANHALIAEALAAARAAEVIVLAIGDTEQTSREGFAKNHLGDRTDLDLVGQQNDLFVALKALGKPIVVAAINGRPPSWPMVAEGANSILECWYAGQEGGTAIADALFGDVNPGAKLPVTVVRNEGQVPYFYHHKPSARRGYLFDDTAPLWPCGHGLSYTRFALGPKTFRLWDRAMRETVEPGEVEISSGPSSALLKTTTLVIA